MDIVSSNYTERLERISQILKGEFKFLYLVALISSDKIVDKDSANDSIEKLQFIKDNIRMLNLDMEDRKQIEKFVDDGMEICKQNLIEYK